MQVGGGVFLALSDRLRLIVGHYDHLGLACILGDDLEVPLWPHVFPLT